MYTAAAAALAADAGPGAPTPATWKDWGALLCCTVLLPKCTAYPDLPGVNPAAVQFSAALRSAAGQASAKRGTLPKHAACNNASTARGACTTCHTHSIPGMRQAPAPVRPGPQQARWGHLLWTAAQLRSDLKRIHRTGDTSRPISRAVVWLLLRCGLPVGLFMSDFDAALQAQHHSQRGSSVRCAEHAWLVRVSNGGVCVEDFESLSRGDK